MEDEQSSLRITGSFIRYLETGDRSVIERFTLEELETNISKHKSEKGHPVYQAIEGRITELRAGERYMREAEEKWNNRIIGFLSGLIVALIIILLKRYLW
jgi:capsular polysaccharide biosynthesis protein